jgi:hypothetical protein
MPLGMTILIMALQGVKERESDEHAILIIILGLVLDSARGWI